VLVVASCVVTVLFWQVGSWFICTLQLLYVCMYVRASIVVVASASFDVPSEDGPLSPKHVRALIVWRWKKLLIVILDGVVLPL
jgi:hypothetical protein